jgi:hypothetical protein
VLQDNRNHLCVFLLMQSHQLKQPHHLLLIVIFRFNFASFIQQHVETTLILSLQPYDYFSFRVNIVCQFLDRDYWWQDRSCTDQKIRNQVAHRRKLDCIDLLVNDHDALRYVVGNNAFFFHLSEKPS